MSVHEITFNPDEYHWSTATIERKLLVKPARDLAPSRQPQLAFKNAFGRWEPLDADKLLTVDANFGTMQGSAEEVFERMHVTGMVDGWLECSFKPEYATAKYLHLDEEFFSQNYPDDVDLLLLRIGDITYTVWKDEYLVQDGNQTDYNVVPADKFVGFYTVKPEPIPAPVPKVE